MPKIAIVTGANKGIGYGIVQTLGKALSPDHWKIYLTARDIGRGNAALKDFHSQGFTHVNFHQLDIDDDKSIVAFKNYLQATYPTGINILINNAGIAFTGASTTPFSEQAEITLKTNFWSTLNVCNHLFPLLAKHARVVHVASSMGTMVMEKMSEDLRKTVKSISSMSNLETFMKTFVNDVKAGDHEKKGWPNNAYGVSKIGVIVLASLQAQMLKQDDRHIVVNACCPGFVDTDMTGHKGSLTIQQGADTPCYLATLESDEPCGQFVAKRAIIQWK